MYYLSDMISEKTICLNLEAKDWEEAVRVSGELLLNNGSIKKEYIDAMIESVKTNGPYIVIAPGIALPHADPTYGVIEPCMSIVTLKNPMNFGNKNNDPVKLIIAFGTIDHTAHVKALSKIARIIGDEQKLDKLMNANKIDQVIEIISLEVGRAQ